MTRRALFNVFALTLAFGLSAALAAAEAGTATVMQVKQPATVSNDGKSFAKLKLGSTLRSGAIVRTGEGGRILLRLADGSKTALGPNSDLALRRLPGNQDPVRATLSLFKGTLRAMVRHLTGRSSFHVETLNSVVAVKGSDIELGTDGKSTKLNVLETTGLGINLKALLANGKTSAGVDLSSNEKSGTSGGSVEKPHELTAAERQELINRYAGLDMTPPAPREGATGASGLGTAALASKALQRVDKLIAAIEKKGGDASELKAEKAKLEDKVEKAADSEGEGGNDSAQRKYEAVMAALLQVQAVKEGRLPQGAIDELKQLKEAADAERAATEALERAVDKLMEKGEEQRESIGAPALDEAYKNLQPTDAERKALVDAVNEELKQAAETLKEVQAQQALDNAADNAQGNLILDASGVRTQVNSTVLRPDLYTVQRVIYSKRDEGANLGTTQFHHIVTFNHTVDKTWPLYWDLSLNDPANPIVGGVPETYRTLDKIKVFNPSGDCFCLTEQLLTPSDPDGVGPLPFGQARTEFLEINGMPRSYRQIADDGYVFTGLPYSDLTQTVTQLGSGFRIDYAALSGSYVGPIASFFVEAVNLPAGSAFSLGSLLSTPPDLRSLALADFSGLPTGAFLQVTISSPDYGTRVIAPVFNPAAFRDAFREGWR